jgi:hypothetical protein
MTEMGITGVIDQAVPPNLREAVAAAVAGRGAVRWQGELPLIPTDVLLPSGATVVLAIEGGLRGGEVVLSDLGQALQDAGAFGISLTRPAISAARRAVRRFGLRYAGTTSDPGTVLRAPPAMLSALEFTIPLLANAAQAAAQAALAAARPALKADRHLRLRVMLQRAFPDALLPRSGVVLGASRKPHKFDFLLRLPNARHMGIDHALPEPQSVASAVVGNLDVRAAANQNLRQVIAFDDDLPWPAPLLEQLRLSQVPVVATSWLEERLPELAA